MAALKVIKRDPFKRGDTVNFMYEFDPPYVGFDWSTVQVNCAFTNQSAPANNSAAAAIRTNQALTVNADNSAYFNFQLTRTESLALIPASTYHDECELKENGTNFLTPITGETVVTQDYII